MASSLVQSVFALGRTPFKTANPFLFCMYHNDAFPAGDPKTLGPTRDLLVGRDMGSDFSYKNGWSMYHGERNSGFPVHPHRGFETITIVQQGLVDHSDSLGCTTRYGGGDTQWMTAGAGIQHSEMFPWVKTDAPNPLVLYQIWLNLPKKDKFAQPDQTMFWAEKTPHVLLADGKVDVTVIAGELAGVRALPPPKASYAADPTSDVAAWILRMEPGAKVTLPPAKSGSAAKRTVYFVGTEATTLRIGDNVANGAALRFRNGATVDASQPLTLEAIGGVGDVLLLQGKPINEPVAQHGPFVMNTQEEIYQCFDDFQRTRFGGWKFGSAAPVLGKDVPRHCVHPDGRRELPTDEPAAAAAEHAAAPAAAAPAS